MHKTTVYLDEDVRKAVKATARLRGVSEAQVIRDSIRAGVSPARPAPRSALFAAEPMAERADELLAGFGER